jgi:hypothetical protein
MLQAVKDGHLITWPGLMEDAINNHLKLTPAIAMGHMSQRRQNIRSTSKAPTDKRQPPDTDLGTKTHLVYAVESIRVNSTPTWWESSGFNPAKETIM